jgi:hypothetical protein
VNPEPSVSPDTATSQLVKGILRDAQELLNQQVRMFRSELKQEVRQLRSGMVSLLIGAVVAILALILLLGMLVHLLAEHTQIPLWGCYGIVGGGLGLVGLALVLGGRKSVSDVHLAPPPASAQALKENVEWLKNLKQNVAERTT